MRDAQRRDQIFVALACERRRVALSLLSDHQELTLPDLADEIAEREHRRSLTDIPRRPFANCISSCTTSTFPGWRARTSSPTARTRTASR
ncbi:hypothetical protein ACFQH8_15365 [Halomicroarcula sp. GCM10025710]